MKLLNWFLGVDEDDDWHARPEQVRWRDGFVSGLFMGVQLSLVALWVASVVWMATR